jgi:hypothetical protein
MAALMGVLGVHPKKSADWLAQAATLATNLS